MIFNLSFSDNKNLQTYDLDLYGRICMDKQREPWGLNQHDQFPYGDSNRGYMKRKSGVHVTAELTPNSPSSCSAWNSTIQVTASSVTWQNTCYCRTGNCKNL